MPHSVRDVCTLALRKLGVLRAGGTPTSADAETARLSLESWYAEAITQGTFGRVYNVVVATPQTVTPYPNMHVSATTDDVIVDLPQTVPADYWWTYQPCRDYGWGKFVPLGGDPEVIVPRDKAIVQVTSSTNNTRLTYIFDRTNQRWMRTDTIALEDEAPLSARGIDGLASLLAMRMTEYFGPELLSPITQQSANRYKVALVTNYGNEEDC